MKSFSNFLVVVGTVFIVFCIAGYILIWSTGATFADVDRGIEFYNAISNSELFASEAAQISAWDRIRFWLMQYRLKNLITGIAAFVLTFLHAHLPRIDDKYVVYVKRVSNFLFYVGTVFILLSIAAYIVHFFSGEEYIKVDSSIRLINALSNAEIYGATNEISVWDRLLLWFISWFMPCFTWFMQYRAKNMVIGIVAYVFSVFVDHLYYSQFK